LTFVKLRKSLSPKEVDEARRVTQKSIEESQYGIVMLERGLGLGYDGVILAYYRDYSDYSRHKQLIKSYPFLELSDVEGFLISQDDQVHYRPLTLRILGGLLAKNVKAQVR
jgi:hypothetical protein